MQETQDQIKKITNEYDEQKKVYDEIDKKINRNANSMKNLNNQIDDTTRKLRKSGGWGEVQHTIEKSSKEMSRLTMKARTEMLNMHREDAEKIVESDIFPAIEETAEKGKGPCIR